MVPRAALGVTPDESPPAQAEEIQHFKGIARNHDGLQGWSTATEASEAVLQFGTDLLEKASAPSFHFPSTFT